MGWKKFKKKSKKTLSKTTKDAKQVVDDSAKAAKDAKDAAEKAAKDALDTTVSEVSGAIGTSLDWFESSANGFSAAAQSLANDAQKELNRVGDLAKAILDDIFLAALDALVDQVFDDLEEFIDEGFDILEDIGEEAAAVAELATTLGNIDSESDLTDALKVTFVTYMRTYPNFISHAALSDVTGFKSVSYGVFGSIAGAGRGLGADGGLAANASQLTEAYAFQRDATNVDMALFAGYAQSVGTSDGVGGGVEAASWRDKPSNLAGKFLGVSITLEDLIGGAIAFYFSDDLTKFLGINLGFSASPDAGVEFDVVTGETFTYLF